MASIMQDTLSAIDKSTIIAPEIYTSSVGQERSHFGDCELARCMTYYHWYVNWKGNGWLRAADCQSYLVFGDPESAIAFIIENRGKLPEHRY